MIFVEASDIDRRLRECKTVFAEGKNVCICNPVSLELSLVARKHNHKYAKNAAALQHDQVYLRAVDTVVRCMVTTFVDWRRIA